VSGILNENKVFFIQEEKFSLSIHKVLLPSGKNYFQGLIIYFQSMKIFFQGLVIYFQSLKIVLNAVKRLLSLGQKCFV
jgi:hypothetical protein